MTALTEFTHWIRDEVAPLLKGLGFTRAGLTFRIRVQSNIAIVNIQKSSKSSAAAVHFTATAGVWCRRIAEMEGAMSESTPSIEDCHWTQRLGEMTSVRNDVWWVLQADQREHGDLRHFLDALKRGVSSMQAMASDEALRDLWLTGVSPGLTNIQRLMYLSILLQEIGPMSALAAVTDELLALSKGKPVRPSVLAHLSRLTAAAKKNAAN